MMRAEAFGDAPFSGGGWRPFAVATPLPKQPAPEPPLELETIEKEVSPVSLIASPPKPDATELEQAHVEALAIHRARDAHLAATGRAPTLALTASCAPLDLARPPYVDRYNRLRAPRLPTFIADDGEVLYGPAADAAANRHWESRPASPFQRDTGHGPETPAQYRARSSCRPSQIAPLVASEHRSSGHAPREASNTRTPGSRRRTSSRSSGGGDSGDSDGESDPDSASRTCACGCGASLTGRRPQTIYDIDACRKRAERATEAPPRTCEALGCDRPVSGRYRYCRESCKEHAAKVRDAERARLADARLAGYLNFEDGDSEEDRLRKRIGLLPRFPEGEYEWLLTRANEGCRCNGAHLDGGVVGCFRCGLPQKVAS